jgi:hypothetical protein
MYNRVCSCHPFIGGMRQKPREIGTLAPAGKCDELPADATEGAARRFAEPPAVPQVAVYGSPGPEARVQAA